MTSGICEPLGRPAAGVLLRESPPILYDDDLSTVPLVLSMGTDSDTFRMMGQINSRNYREN
ncbi:hypothetical protein TcasGA2_TC032743 [Tribolium castaneum]|uniref:Uncharacterized protein n=1 Tax=Tribolium castaneum TaxID=7070 RepID=A0A139WIQ7_TRICA|nr:hypothetical protein TcasGA2_TC032743 [Tribolium castaneum]